MATALGLLVRERLTGAPPPKVAEAAVDLIRPEIEAAAGGPSGAVARVWVADGHATALRRVGRAVGQRSVGGRDGDVVEIDIASSDGLAREIAGYGPDALVLEPDSLRSDVMARLAAQAGMPS
jgi:proteasome accessory factor B